MQEYIEYQGTLFHPYEWHGGFRATHKEVKKSQAARRREVKKGFAKIVEGN